MNTKFKNWVKSHNPKEKWDWNDPVKLKEQLVATIKTSGDIDLKSIFLLMFTNKDSGLTVSQNHKFLLKKY